MKISIVVACANNGCIGLNNTLPWRQSADLKQFKSITMGHPLVMGRKTYDSIGKPLPGRKTIVVTKQADWNSGYDEVEVQHSLHDAFEAAKKQAQQLGVNEVMLVGGATLYEQALDLADTLYVTHIDAHVEGDAFFPKIDSTLWQQVSAKSHHRDEKNQYGYTFSLYERKLKNI